MSEVKLNEYDKDEWRDVAKKLRPDWSDSEFDRNWEDFQELKSKVEKQKTQH